MRFINYIFITVLTISIVSQAQEIFFPNNFVIDPTREYWIPNRSPFPSLPVPLPLPDPFHVPCFNNICPQIIDPVQNVDLICHDFSGGEIGWYAVLEYLRNYSDRSVAAIDFTPLLPSPGHPTNPFIPNPIFLAEFDGWHGYHGTWQDEYQSISEIPVWC